jgi:hypothetical protein
VHREIDVGDRMQEYYINMGKNGKGKKVTA